MYKNYKWLSFLFVLSFLMFSAVLELNAVTSPKNKTENILKEGFKYFQEPYGSWAIENKQLILKSENSQKSRTNIWIKENYGDFILKLDFKLNPGTNSGVFFRTADTDNPVQTGIEVQIRDDYGKTPIDKNFCGSIYDIQEVSENRVKKPGEWNQLEMTCKGTFIEVSLNKKKVIDIDLSEWEDAGKNPDGTKNKFNTAYKDMPLKGKIGFQDHGGKVWYRNIRITKL
jgi:hypothetical protein